MIKKNFCLYMFFPLSLLAYDINRDETSSFLTQTTHQAASIGAPVTGSLIEGCIGSFKKSESHYITHYDHTKNGFLGSSQGEKHAITVKDQPGVFPAALVGDSSIGFQFHIEDENEEIIPVIVRPDGTVYQGLAMHKDHSPQVLEIASPAQRGIYTLFVLGNGKALAKNIIVEVAVKNQPKHNTSLQLQPFNPENDQNHDLISAEFVYSPSS